MTRGVTPMCGWVRYIRNRYFIALIVCLISTVSGADLGVFWYTLTPVLVHFPSILPPMLQQFTYYVAMIWHGHRRRYDLVKI